MLIGELVRMIWNDKRKLKCAQNGERDTTYKKPNYLVEKEKLIDDGIKAVLKQQHSVDFFLRQLSEFRLSREYSEHHLFSKTN